MAINWKSRKLHIEELAEKALKDKSKKDLFILNLLRNYKLDVGAIIEELREKDNLNDDDKQYYDRLSKAIDNIKKVVKDGKEIKEIDIMEFEKSANDILANPENKNNLIQTICNYYCSDVGMIIENLNDSIMNIGSGSTENIDNELQYYQNLEKTLKRIQKSFGKRQAKER